MKYFVKFFVVTLFLLVCTHSLAENKVVILDMKYVLNFSKAGKGAQEYLKKTFEDNNKKFTNQENNLKDEEQDLLKQKTVLSKEDYKKKSDELRNKVMKYQKERRETFEKISNQRTKAREDLINKINPILNSYISENDISLIIDKKFVLGGNTSLDITNIIIEKLDKEVPSLKLN